MRAVLAAALLLLLATAGEAQLPRPTRTDQANNHLRIKEWMFGAKIGRTVTVATTGGDYTTLSAAVAYVTTQTPSSIAPWVIIVYNGDHSAAPVALPAWTSVVFLGGIDDDGDRSGLAVRTGTGYDFALKVTGSTNIAGGGGGGNYFETIDTPAGTDPVADSSSDTLTLACTGGLTCTGNATTDTVTLALPADDDVPEVGDFGALALTGAVTSSGPSTTIAADAVTLGSQTAGGYAASATEGGAASSVAANAVALGTDTTGGYAASATEGGAASSVAANSVTLGTDTVGGYAASTTEAGPATTATSLTANGANCPGGQFAAGVDAAGAAEGCAAPSGGAGDVVGPASSTDNAIARFDSTTGKVLQNSLATVTDAGGLAVPQGSDSAYAVAIGSGAGLYASGPDNLLVATVGVPRITMSSNGLVTQNGTWVANFGAGSPVFTVPNQDTDSGLGANAANDVGMWAGGSIAGRWLLVTSGVPRALTSGQAADAPASVTCNDSGDGSPGALTVNPVTALVLVTVSDPDGCALTLGESNVAAGVRVEFVIVAGAATFSDTSGVTELAGTFSAGQYDVLSLRYISDRWVETGRSDN